MRARQRGVVGVSPYRDAVAADDITELDIDILRAVAAGHLPDQHLLTVELRRLAVLGLVDFGRGGLSEERCNWSRHAS